MLAAYRSKRCPIGFGRRDPDYLGRGAGIVQREISDVQSKQCQTAEPYGVFLCAANVRYHLITNANFEKFNFILLACYVLSQAITGTIGSFLAYRFWKLQLKNRF